MYKDATSLSESWGQTKARLYRKLSQNLIIVLVLFCCFCFLVVGNLYPLRAGLRLVVRIWVAAARDNRITAIYDYCDDCT